MRNLKILYYKIKDILVNLITSNKPFNRDIALFILNNVIQDEQSSCILREECSYKPIKYQLSIIVPTYNNAIFIERCITSVLTQDTTYKYELIIVNDGSTDNTTDILDKYQNLPNVRIINQSNKGFSGARNTGIVNAVGKYLSFLDSDDFLLPNSINALMDVAIGYNADIVEGNYSNIYSDGSEEKKSFHGFQSVKPLGNMLGFMWGKVYKRNIFNGLKLNENYWFEDSINAHILFWRANQCYLISDYVYGYYQNVKSITHTARKSYKSIDSLYITNQLLIDHKELNLSYNQDYYEFFLRMNILTFNRTRFLDVNLRKAIFTTQCELYSKYFKGFHTQVSKNRIIEKSLIQKNYKLYVTSINFIY